MSTYKYLILNSIHFLLLIKLDRIVLNCCPSWINNSFDNIIVSTSLASKRIDRRWSNSENRLPIVSILRHLLSIVFFVLVQRAPIQTLLCSWSVRWGPPNAIHVFYFGDNNQFTQYLWSISCGRPHHSPFCWAIPNQMFLIMVHHVVHFGWHCLLRSVCPSVLRKVLLIVGGIGLKCFMTTVIWQ